MLINLIALLAATTRHISLVPLFCLFPYLIHIDYFSYLETILLSSFDIYTFSPLSLLLYNLLSMTPITTVPGDFGYNFLNLYLCVFLLILCNTFDPLTFVSQYK